MNDDEKARHAREVRRMFSRIAPRYDLMNHLLSANMDIRWRKKAAKACGPGSKVLDLCIGSGDMALAWVREHQEGTVIGLDFCRELMEQVKQKAESNSRIVMAQGDALAMPFADKTFDVVTCAFGVRNLADVGKGMQEVARVSRSGGCCAILDFFRPQNWISRAFHATYGRYVIPWAGRWLAADPDAYEYLPHSMQRFLPLDEFTALMKQVGFQDVHHRHFSAGILTLVSGRRGAG